jgi:hypothetical protein
LTLPAQWLYSSSENIQQEDMIVEQGQQGWEAENVIYNL